jgi:hypothetical protein
MSAWYKQTVRAHTHHDVAIGTELSLIPFPSMDAHWQRCLVWQVRDPSASLSADRRGTVSLPDPESCFGKEVSNGRYGAKDRRAMISHIENMPSVMWPLQTIWSFKNPSKVGHPLCLPLHQCAQIRTTLARLPDSPSPC